MRNLVHVGTTVQDRARATISATVVNSDKANGEGDYRVA
jgi:hypothetical protein